MAFSLEERTDPKHGMLIVVDMQNDFCHRDGAACKRGRDMGFVQNMIPRLVNLVNQARAHKFPICFVRTSGNQWTNSPVWTEFKNPELLACAEGTWGAEFHEGLEPKPGEMIVTKHRYSAFVGTDLCRNIVKDRFVLGKADLGSSLRGTAIFWVAAIHAAVGPNTEARNGLAGGRVRVKFRLKIFHVQSKVQNIDFLNFVFRHADPPIVGLVV